MWSKCASCNRPLYQKQLNEQLYVCPNCQHHYPLSAPDRIAQLTDPGTFEEFDANIHSADPLRFDGMKPYLETLERARSASRLSEAVITGRGTLEGRALVLGAMDFRFVGGSMGSAVGEKVTRLFEEAAAEGLPVVVVCASGGARMQEGLLSLYQMAKTSAAVRQLAEARLPYLAVLANPTTGGVLASFASLADVIFAEPGARIGFAGPRVIESTIREKLPRGFQTAEFLLEHGMIDAVVPRHQLRERIALFLNILSAVPHG